MNTHIKSSEYFFKNSLRVAVESFFREHGIYLSTLGISKHHSPNTNCFCISIEASCNNKIMQKTKFKSDSMWVSYGLPKSYYDQFHHFPEEGSIECSFSINLHTEAPPYKDNLASYIVEDIISQLSKSMETLIYEKASKEFDASVEDELSSDS